MHLLGQQKNHFTFFWPGPLRDVGPLATDRRSKKINVTS